MKLPILQTSILALLISSGIVLGQDTANAGRRANENLRVTIQKWVEVMKSIQTEQKNWKAEQEVLEGNIASIEAEIGQLESELAESKKRRATADAASVDKLAQKEEYSAARIALREGLNGLESEVSAVIPLLPKELTDEAKIKTAIEDHQKFSATTDKESLPLNKRLSPMLTLLTEAEKFNQVVTTYEGRAFTAQGQTRLLDVVYFGLSTGFAADEKGELAFRLQPSPTGWQEVPLTGEGLAKTIRELIDIAKGTGETRLVNLPLELGK